MDSLSNSFLKYIFSGLFLVFLGCATGSQILEKLTLGATKEKPNGFQVLGAPWGVKQDLLVCSSGSKLNPEAQPAAFLFPPVSKFDQEGDSKGTMPLKVLSVSERGALVGWCGASFEPRLIGNFKVGASNPGAEFKYDDFAVNFAQSFIAARRGKEISVFSFFPVQSESKDTLVLSGELREIDRRRLEVMPLDLAFTHDGTSLLIAGSDGAIYRWKFFENAGLTKGGSLFEKYIGPSAAVSSIVPSPLGRMFFSGDWDGAINGWLLNDADRQSGEYDKNYFTGQFVADSAVRVKFDRGTSTIPVESMVISNDGAKLVAATRDGTVEYWNIRGPRLLASQVVHASAVTTMAISANSKLLATAGRDAKVNVMDLSTCDNVEPWQNCALNVKRTIDLAAVKSMVFRGDELYVSTSDGKIRALDYKSDPVPQSEEESIL